MFNEKIAIVAGGASGIGRALCTELAKMGTRVVIADLNIKEAETLAVEIKNGGGTAEAYALDISNYDNVCALIAYVSKTYGRLDFLFNSAGLAIGGETWRIDLQRWRKIVDVNLWGSIYISTEAYKIMLKQRSGHIINVASGAGIFPTPMRTPYSTTKYGVVGFSTAFRPEAANYGIKVSVVCPGPVQTPILNTSEIVGAKDSIKKQLASKNNWMAPEKAAKIIIIGVKKNKAIIPITAIASVMWRFYRFFPNIYDKTIAKKMVAGYLPHLEPMTLNETNKR